MLIGGETGARRGVHGRPVVEPGPAGAASRSRRSTARRWRCRRLVGVAGPDRGGRLPIGRGGTRGAGSRRNIAAHYDLGNDFYRLFLDETMTYSSAVFASAGAVARRRPAQQVPAHRRAAPACGAASTSSRSASGWGGFALYAAGELGCRVTSITISRGAARPGARARPRCRPGGPRRHPAARLPRHRGHVRRDRLDRDARGRRRRVLRDVLRGLRRALRPGGRLSLQSITSRTRVRARSGAARTGSRRTSSRAGCCPSLAVIERSLHGHPAAHHRRRRTSRRTTSGRCGPGGTRFLGRLDAVRGDGLRRAVHPDVGVLPRDQRGGLRDRDQPGPPDRPREATRHQLSVLADHAIAPQDSGTRTSRWALRTMRMKLRRWASGRMCDGSPA